MQVGEFCNREVVILYGDESVKAAAELMRSHHVGDVVLVEEQQGKCVPTGLISDRDLVVEVMVPGLQPEKLAAKDIVTRPVLLAHEKDSLFDALEVMREKGIRRLPVVDDNQALIGIITIDDIIDILTEMLGCVVQVIKRQRDLETQERP
ncbi:MULTISPECIES: CBS domain-containing protein [unclassified Legionella]|uniref:CBS domain-containing protein n=1 Tax=unclassified Legionella TaxID=2622702 RepID=UPI00105551F1|nr:MULTISPECIES: CBS domain-containing protein [unclassified Legionella]MDI9819010.1 CBS domain-containing protein [Legionella sp. PL877]